MLVDLSSPVIFLPNRKRIASTIRDSDVALAKNVLKTQLYSSVDGKVVVLWQSAVLDSSVALSSAPHCCSGLLLCMGHMNMVRVCVCFALWLRL